MGTGEAAALTAAALWAFSSLLYTRINVSAWGLNFSKIVIASAILFLQIATVNSLQGAKLFNGSTEAWVWLALSGAIGLVLGDTWFFRSLQILGARRCLIVQTTAPVFTAILGWIFLGEVLVWFSGLGILLTVGGVAVVVSDKAARGDEPGLFPGSIAAGVAMGIAAAICQAIGAVMSRHAMKNCDALEGTFVRLFAAMVLALVIVVWNRQLQSTARQVCRPEVLKRFVPAIMLGTWLGVWCSQIAFKETTAAAAQTLLSTSPLFAIPMVWMMYGHRMTSRVLVGSIVAVAGVFLLFQ